jgi:SAM-dependent methyltransferase
MKGWAMRGIVVAGAAAAAAGAVALAPRARGETWEEWFTKVARSYSMVPSGPLGWVSSHWTMPRLHGPIYPLMAEALDLRPEDELLEVACGSGVFLTNHASDVSFVAGLDLSDLQIDLARQRLAERITSGTAEIVKGDAVELPWEDARFSAVTCMGSMEAFPDPSRALAEMFRVLRPGGRAVLELGWRVPEGTASHQAFGGMWIWNEADARRLVEDAGFDDVSVTYDDVRGEWTGPVGLLHRLLTLEGMRIVRGTRSG